MRTPRFEIFEGKNNEFFFRLKAKNGKCILQSEGYTQKHNAEGGIEAVKNSLETINIFDHTGWHWFSVIAANLEIVAKSEIYATRYNAKRGAESVRRCAPIAEIVGLTIKKN